MKKSNRQAAIYLRLSRDDGAGSESESIANQRDILLRYCADNGFADIREYSDDGYSGLSFDRPAFQRLIADIELGQIGTVIVKDLSRLGRDYIQTGYYLERFLPENGVRFISVTEGTDTLSAPDDMAPFRAVVNDMYAKDISRKVRSALDSKKQAGMFIGSRAPYGYKKSGTRRGLLIPDPVSAEYVRLLFELFLSGNGLSATARRLDSLGMPSPSSYSGGTQSKWSPAMVRRILTNPTYAGNLTQNRTKKISYKLEKRILLDRDSWITVENTHEAIIAPADFTRAAEKLASHTYDASARQNARHPLSGLVFCGVCGARMSTTGGKSGGYYVCSRWKKDRVCCSNCMSEKKLIWAVGDSVSAQIMKYFPNSHNSAPFNFDMFLPYMSHLIRRIDIISSKITIFWNFMP